MQLFNDRSRAYVARRFAGKGFFSACLLLMVSMLGAAAYAQVEAGQIAGTITDQSGAVVPGAAVTVKNLATNAQRNAVSSATGAYQVVGLEPGNYQVSVAAGAFKPYTANLEVTVGGSVTLDAQLSMSESVTEIQVVAEGGATVNTQTQELSQVVDTEQLSQLPSLTRNPYDFVVLSGNVSNGDNTTSSSTSYQNSTSRGVGYAVNGQRQSGTEILLDGVENIDWFNALVGEQIPIDSVQEFNVVTNNFAAEYGRASGGVVNLTTKSGTNAFHGGGWEYNRLSSYTSNTYNNDALGLPKGIYTRNQFGFLVGGPIVKNKLFFFESTEWTRVRSQAAESGLIADPAFLGYTAASSQAYFNAFGATPYSITSTLDQSDLGIALTQTDGVTPIPAATPILGQVNFKASADAGGDFPQNTYRELGRVDYNMGQNTQMFFRYGQESSDLFIGQQFYGPYPQYDAGESVLNRSALFSLSHSFSPYIFSGSKVSFNRLASPLTYDTAQQNVPMLMFGNASANGLAITFPGLENEMEPGAGGFPFGGPQNTIQLEEDMSWTKGRHSMRYGGQWTYMQMNHAYGAYAQAVEYLQTGIQPGLQNLVDGVLQYYEAAINTQGQLPCVQNPDGSLNVTPECEVTPPVSSPDFSRSYRYKDWAAYGQDSFKLTPRVTVNYGVRYEHYGVQHNNNQNLDSNLYYGSGSNLFDQIANGKVEIAPKSSVGQLWAPRWGTVSPRIGLAWDIFGNGRDSVRAGFGISYERNFGNITFNTIQNPPAYGVIQSFTTSNTTVPVTNSNAGPLANPGPPVGLPPVELRNVNQNINVAQTQFWSLAIQHQLSNSSVVELSYSGAHGVHLYDITAGNPLGGAQAYLGSPFECDGCYTRNNPQYAAVNVRGSGGTSEYESFNAKYQAQNIHHTGVGLIANYTWSHALDDLSSTFADGAQGGSGYIGNLGYLDPTHPGLDWGSADFDVPNRVVISPIWQTPWFKTGHSVWTEVAGGWSVSGIFTARSGAPFSAFDYTYNLNGYSGVPRIVPATPVAKHKAGSGVNVGPNQFQILTIPGANDLAPFSPTLGIDDFGPFPTNMTARNAFRGPGAWNADLSAAKKFKITERAGLEFRAEGFDILNHHNLYVNESALAVQNTPGTIGDPLPVIALKGGLNSIALGGNHDERRFGQFSLRLDF